MNAITQHTPILSARRRRKCENLTHAVLPELHATPVYFRGAPPDYCHKPTCLAFTPTGQLDNWLYDDIVDSGEWQGPGVVVIFCRRLSLDETLGLTLHELGHGPIIVDSPAVKSTPAYKGFLRLQLAENSKLPFSDSPTLPRWFQSHGCQFVRRCLHLHHRAWANGYAIGLPDIHFAGHAYDLSEPWKYLHALGDEPRRMRGATMAEIGATPAPPAFRKLFNQDFQDWWKHKHPSEPNDLLEK